MLPACTRHRAVNFAVYFKLMRRCEYFFRRNVRCKHFSIRLRAVTYTPCKNSIIADIHCNIRSQRICKMKTSYIKRIYLLYIFPHLVNMLVPAVYTAFLCNIAGVKYRIPQLFDSFFLRCIRKYELSPLLSRKCKRTPLNKIFFLAEGEVFKRLGYSFFPDGYSICRY